MVMRITENMKFNNAVNSMFNVQNQYNEILEKMSSQKKINRISDDPLGMTMLLNLREVKSSIAQYQRNSDSGNGWLAMTESTLSGANELLSKASELAIGQGTSTATAETRRIAAEGVQQLIDQMLSLANSKYGDRYLFSGSRMDIPPFSATTASARIDTPVTGAANTFDGTVTAGGTYTAVNNNTYAVKIVSGGTLAAATYQVSADGGKTWGAENNDLDTGTINLPDGISLTFNDNGVNHLTAGDFFSVNAYAEGYYQGNGDNLTIDVGKDASVNYNISGEAVFTGQNGGVDAFTVLNDLKSALANNDPNAIRSQIDKLKDGQEQVNLHISKVGSVMNRIELSKSNLLDLEQKVAELTSTTEDADIAELSTSLAMKEIVLQASYSMATRIANNTILDFIK